MPCGSVAFDLPHSLQVLLVSSQGRLILLGSSPVLFNQLKNSFYFRTFHKNSLKVGVFHVLSDIQSKFLLRKFGITKQVLGIFFVESDFTLCKSTY